MPPPAIINPTDLSCDELVYSREQIYELIPQRHEFAQLDGIIFVDEPGGIIAAYRDVRADEWWCRGHLPGRPIFPGVLMLECAAQLCAFFRALMYRDGEFMGFGGVDQCKFRGAVIPPARVILIGRAVEQRSRRFVSAVQAYVQDAMVFEGLVSGLPLRQ